MKMENIILVFVLCIGAVLSLDAEYPARYPNNEQKKVNFACENSFVNLSCRKPGERIRILIANYGRFSLVVCGQGGIDKYWNVQCGADSSMSVVTERCNGKRQCSFRANDATFGEDPCPGTKKYVEVQYYCERVVEPTTDPPYTAITETTSQPNTTVTQPPTTPRVEPTTTTEGDHHGGPGTRFCRRTERDGLLWPQTRAEALRKVKCPADQTGDAYWACGKDGDWVASPDFTRCVSKWLDDIGALVEGDLPVAEAMTQLNTHLKGKTLGAGDLRKASRELLPGMMKKMRKELGVHMTKEERRDRIHTFNKDMVKSGSGLLDNKQHKSWQSLDLAERKKSATSLIVSLEQMALEVATTIEQPETFTSAEQNILMEVSVVKLSSSRSGDLRLPIMQDGLEKEQRMNDFSLPLDAFSTINANDEVTVTYLFYNNLETLMNPQPDSMDSGTQNSSREINSNVVSASVTKHTLTAQRPHGKTQLTRPMNFTLSHKQGLGDKVAVCAYWNYNESTLNGEWSTDGCRVVDSTNDYTTCQCNHLTNFAVLMDVSGVKLHKYHQMTLTAITYVGCSISIICLLMCFISFCIFRNLQSDRNTIHKNLVLCLMLAELLFLFGIGQTEDKVGCAVIAVFLHFFFLASFSWMCLEGIQLYFMLIEVFESERSRVRWFYAFGYGVPTVIVAISAAVDHTGYGTPTHCWLRTDNYFVLSFVVPAAIVILINIVMLSIAVYMMCRHAGVTASAIQARQKGKLEKIGNGHNSIVSDTSVSTIEMLTWLKGSAVLVVLLGLTWTFGFVYVSADTVSVAYIFTILNSLQGLFIFIFHCFMDRKVKKEWRRAIYRAKWLPVCCRVNLGGYNGNFSSPTPTSSSGPHNYFLKFWSGRKRKRSSTSSATGRNRRSDLDSFLRSDTSSGCTTGTGVNRYSNQSDKLLPNGQNVYSAMPTCYEGGVNGDLSVVDCSVVDSEYVTEYCQHALQVSQEKREYSSGSDSEDENCCKDHIANDNISKNRLSYLSADSNLKLNSEFASDNKEGKINFAVLDDAETKNDYKDKSEGERNLLNDLLSLYVQGSKGKNGVQDPAERISTSQNRLASCENPKSDNKLNVTKSAPDLKLSTLSTYSSQMNDSTSTPLLGSLPDLSSATDEDNDSDPCSKSVNISTSTK